jgi:hypothetical protein
MFVKDNLEHVTDTLDHVKDNLEHGTDTLGHVRYP